ncbi:hypothetical protein SAMN02746041_01407 [Desulfacinum hydrothermale DSM 13146]|uniref:DUF116 domain-containing protein n=1 Tax=Desulfacinum hydrothermale DSM 13146 TaxID=1121390 RepID=A0A1W1XFS9_9BACT|nr:DUF116 domain-containing protein [Desulfacinum hydrothermale]SMC22371.1 hypothetical protein SAMN02746041_01407 [Desulfacinum hydrothermale DSM 13146]
MARALSDKALLILLLLAASALVCAVLALLFAVPYYGFARIHPRLPLWAGLFFGGLAAAQLGVVALLVTAALRGRDVPFSATLRGFTAKGLLPLLVFVGRLVGISKRQVQHAFVAFNNELVLARCRSGQPPRRILLLMPHCLQRAECSVRITYHVSNCKRCGQCPIGGLLALSETYGVDLAVATGGTIARRIVVQTRPDLIVAVACERDLVSGIQDTLPLPVYGIFNQRPNGPCFNTLVPLDRVRSVLDQVLQREALHG